MIQETESLRPGQIVCSKAGHDKGRLYLVVEIAADRAILTDGKHRPLGRLKPKNTRHIKIIEHHANAKILQLINQPGDPGSMNAKVRELLALYDKKKAGPDVKMEEI
jgi:hypothetical protein